MKTFGKVLGAVEILIALFMALLGIYMFVGFLTGDRYAQEWGGLVIPIDLMIAAGFGWAGYVLMVNESRVWRHQLIPLVVIVAIAAFLVWEDNVPE